MIDKDDIEKRLKLVKRILSTLISKFPNQLNFIFVTDIIDDAGNNKTGYVYNIRSDNSVKNLMDATNVVGNLYYNQRRYHDMALDGTSMIVVCVDDQNLQQGLKQIQQELFYKVTSVRVVDHDIFYDLEGLDNSGMKDYMGYNSKRFKKLISIYKQN